ncbi:glutamine--fructose-6-phosphate transaminase [Natronoarchaeum philippinense]|uniref:Glutamine--fructose-6-phosphate aminotransferase [isomerizing] n=1 Tax=Natronoarchaeum philippinense TaxID=558529 RepID=A0A285P182_NATPI|nr:glutamine--fructose-6-phosphate transaminase (isomerizing) [Natronoarchaeum philippinense]SNZ15218.1 glutamine--fructose-6-phosphate transaminase [Natronoarchaeum philippinense]
MCGIVGYVGRERQQDARDVLVGGLSNLEYRGYDSAGVALANGDVTVVKREGEVDELVGALDERAPSSAPVGIGHTRWSTHGEPSDENAHPHTDCTGEVAVVHNGIIENYDQLRAELREGGHEFESGTDTEVVPHLIEEALEAGADRDAAFRDAIDRLEGSYAIAAVFEDDETVFAARQDSPLVIGVGDDGYYLASDVPAFIDYTDRVCYLEDGQFARIDAETMSVTDADGKPVETSLSTVEWDAEDAGKSGYDHYMLKEIHEQPRALRKCLRERVDGIDGSVDLDLDRLDDADRIHLVACGTSYHAALYGAQVLRERGVPAQAFVASEYDRTTLAGETPLVIGVTQSGETADTLGALRTARAAGAETLAVTNTVGSTAARECDQALYVRAGPEIGVAATKTFASQQLALHAFALWHSADSIDPERIDALRSLPDQVQSVLDDADVESIAAEYADSSAFFFIGRGHNHPVALEGALKLKEITYEHAEGFPAGELKHGPLALMEDDAPVIALVTGDGERARKTLNNVKEVQSRGAPVIAVTDGRLDVEQYANHVLTVPETDPTLAPLLANVQLQLLAYWIAARLGRPIDKPRHLAKSVTVE